MKATSCGLSVAVACFLGLFAVQSPGEPLQAAEGPSGKLTSEQTALSGTAIAAVIEANGGKPPATGEQLWKTLTKLGKFAQLSIPFSRVHLESGLSNPRVVIAPVIDGLSSADVTKPNFNGRLYLAANMERGADGGDPRVTSVEFISWNTQRRRYDFGMIENMGGESEPVLRIVDGGRCFSCHKNRGPILNPLPWSNSVHDPETRAMVSSRLRIVPALPPGGAIGANVRDRIDGMALASDESAAVDESTRLGTVLQLNRHTFQLMNRSTSGRKAFVALLSWVVAPGSTNADEKQLKASVEEWGNHNSYIEFTRDWAALTKASSSGILVDHPPFEKVQRMYKGKIEPLPSAPVGGFRTSTEQKAFEEKLNSARRRNDRTLKEIALQQAFIAEYDTARAEGKNGVQQLQVGKYGFTRLEVRHGIPSRLQPSNPKAFIQPPVKATQRPSGMVNPVMLAGTIGLTSGDRDFLTRTLKEAVERVSKPKVTSATLARAVFEGPEFTDVLAGGPLPDRDEFKDRFVAGLQSVLKTQYPFTQGIPIKRTDYASGPAFDPKRAEEKELAVVPTTACLRCHEVRASGKRTAFETIAPLVFDPLDKSAREAWVKSAPEKRRAEVLSRLAERLVEDKDMPPEDSPEHTLYRVKDAAAFDELKDFLAGELGKLKGK